MDELGVSTRLEFGAWVGGLGRDDPDTAGESLVATGETGFEDVAGEVLACSYR